VTLKLSEDGSGIGAALVAAAAVHQTKPAGTSSPSKTAAAGKPKFQHV